MPPVNVACTHVSPIWLLEVIDAIFASEVGGPGFVKMIAPFPDAEATDVPTILIALTLAYIDDPQGKLKGVACNVDIGMEHVSSVLAVMSHVVLSEAKVTLSLFLISTLYPVMGVEPSPGKVQVITTLLLLTAVDGADYVSGTWAARMARLDDKTEYPTVLRASTLNEYVLPEVKVATVV